MNLSSSNGFTPLYAQLEHILEHSTGERDVSTFLASHPELLRWAVCWTGGHSTYVLKEFAFGSQFRADFVVVTSYSGMWEVNMIELEPHNDKVFTRAGVPTNKLNTALKQVDEWHEYIERNPMVRSDLAKKCLSGDLLKLSSGREMPTNFTGNRLNDINSAIFYHYHIFIGTRGGMSDEARNRRNQVTSRSGVRISSYSHFVDIARNIFKADQGERVNLTESKE